MMLRRVLLGCGIASSVLYVTADVLASLRYEGYRYADQAVSELLAAGAPTRPLMIALVGIPYSLLVVAFAAGVWLSAGRTRAGRLTGVLLVGYAAVGAAGGLIFNMDQRGTEATLRGSLHGPATLVMSLFLLLAMGFASTLLGRSFRIYTYATIATLIVFGGLSGLYVPRLAANEPTPWMGVVERINIYATMLWMGALAIGLRRDREAAAPQPPAQPSAGLQAVPR